MQQIPQCVSLLLLQELQSHLQQQKNPLVRLCDEIISHFTLSRSYIQDLLIEHQQKQIQLLMRLKPTSIAEIVMSCESEAYSNHTQVLQLRKHNLDLMKQINNLEQIIMVMSQNQGEYTMLLSKLKQYTVELAQCQAQLDGYRAILSNKLLLEKQLKQIKSISKRG